MQNDKNYSKKSMVLGIISVATSCIAIGFIPGIIALIFGIIALKENHPDRSKAIVGVVTSCVTLAIIIAGFIYALFTIPLPGAET